MPPLGAVPTPLSGIRETTRRETRAHAALIAGKLHGSTAFAYLCALVQRSTFHPDMCPATTSHSDAVTVAISVDRVIWFEASPCPVPNCVAIR